MASGYEVIELPSVNLTPEIPEPYYVKKAHNTLIECSKLYEEMENDLITLKDFSKGKLLLKGRDYLNEKTGEVEQYFKSNVYSTSTDFSSWDLYTKIKRERDRRIKIYKDLIKGHMQRNNNEIAEKQAWLNDNTHAVWNERYDRIDELKAENKRYQQDLDLLEKLEGQDDNEY